MRRLEMNQGSTRVGERGAVRARIIAVVLLLCVAVLVFLRIGHWLVREDPLEKSSAIVVLSGAMPERALEAAEIYRSGYAREIWITQPTEPKRVMQTLGIPFDGEEESSRRVLLHQGVPQNAIRILSPTIVNTADEMDVIADSMKRANGTSVIIVTSKAHTRRIHSLWNRIERGHGRIIVRASATDSFDPRRWWRSTHDALDVVREVLGLLNVWAGLPLKPAR
jgi:uncharacterized SAM-binding protein YcdF (DUF218 family)